MCRAGCTYVLYNFRNLMVQSKCMQVKLEGGWLRVSHASTSLHPRQRLSAPYPIWSVAHRPLLLGGGFLDGVCLKCYSFLCSHLRGCWSLVSRQWLGGNSGVGKT